MSAPTTFDLSAVYTALGIRDPRAVPRMAAGELVPTIQLGSIDSFAPQPVEARGFTQQTVAPGGGVVTVGLQCLAQGGAIVEHASWAGTFPFIFSLSPTPVQPTIGPPSTRVLSMGGLPIRSLIEGLTGVYTSATLLGGSEVTFAANGPALAGVWVPPAWWFQTTASGAVAGEVSIQWREIPQTQGAP